MKLTMENISEQYRRNLWGLRDFHLELTPGVIGLPGPNGAGKSTLMRILATVTQPTEGRVAWNGTDIVKSPVEFLEYMAVIKGMDAKSARQRIEELRENGMQVRVVSKTQPTSGSQSVTPSLEDVYLQLVSQPGVKQ